MQFSHLIKNFLIGALIGLGLVRSGAFLTRNLAALAAAPSMGLSVDASRRSSPGFSDKVTVLGLDEEVELKINVRNFLDQPMTNVTVRDKLPSGWEATDDDVLVTTNAGTSSFSSSDLLDNDGIKIGTLDPWVTAAADYAEISFIIRMNYCPGASEYVNTAFTGSDQQNEFDFSSVIVETSVRCDSPEVEKLVSHTLNPQWQESLTASQGDLVQYKVKVTNTNPLLLNAIRLKDILPEGFTLHSGATFIIKGGETTAPHGSDSFFDGDGYLLGNLEAGKFWEVVYKARVGNCPVEGTKVNRAQVSADEVDSVEDSATVVVPICPPEEEPEVDYKIEKEVKYKDGDWEENLDLDEHTFDPGEKLHFKIKVKNLGEVDAKDVRVVDELPDDIKWVSGHGDYDQDEHKIRFDIGDLPAGEEREFRFVAKVYDEDDLPTGKDYCQTNVVYLKVAGEKVDEDHSKVCIGTPEVLGEVEELPQAGSNPTGLMVAGVMLSAGLTLRKKVSSLFS